MSEVTDADVERATAVVIEWSSGDLSPTRQRDLIAQALADARADCGHHSWAGLMRLLDEHWPDDIFPTRYEDDPARDAGPRIISLMRWVDSLRDPPCS